MISLDNSKILVAGAGGLLGSQLVLELLKCGSEVVAVDINEEIILSKLKNNNIDIRNCNITTSRLDVNNEKEVISFFNEQTNLTGAVNTTYPKNASYGAHFFDVSLSSFNENIALHLGSSFLFTQQCALYFKKHLSPFSLVNLSSIYGVIAPKFEIYEDTKMTTPIEYAAIKSAILHINKYVSAYISDSRFRVNSISPGGIFDNQPESFLQRYKDNTNGAGMLSPQDMIGTIIYLLSDQSRYVTAQNIIIDDGFHL